MSDLDHYRPDEGDLWRDERTPAWRVFVPLFVVIVSLIALVLIPPAITERNAALRQTLTEQYMPLSSLVASIERTTGAELAAARGYALTGDPFFVDRFLAVHSYGNEIASQIMELANEIGGEVAREGRELLQTRDWWASANFGQTRASFREGMAEHQAHFEAVMEAADQLRGRLEAAAAVHNQRITAAERLRAWLTVILAVVALFGAGGAMVLGNRVRLSNRRILERARHEAALRQIAQTMAEADDLQGALISIVGAVSTIARADRVLIEQIDQDLGEVEVVAAFGADTEKPGTRKPRVQSASGARLLANDAGQERRHLALPLVSEGEELGFLTVERSPLRRAFDEVEVRRTHLLADMAAMVLRRLQLVETMRAHEVQLEAQAQQLLGLNETLEDRVRDRTQRIRELSRELTLAEQRERRDLAQVLHDDLQQILFAVQLNLSSLAGRVGQVPAEEVSEEIVRLGEVMGEAIGSTRRLTVDLSPPMEKGAAFADALGWLTSHTTERFGLEVGLHCSDGVEVPSEDMRLLLFQIVRELLFNTVKHAGATRAGVSLERAGQMIAIRVEDNGRGFEPTNVQENGSTIGGFGLRAARERLELFGGEINIESEPGRGTTATVTVPADAISSREE